MKQENRSIFWIPDKYKDIELLWIEVLVLG